MIIQKEMDLLMYWMWGYAQKNRVHDNPGRTTLPSMDGVTHLLEELQVDIRVWNQYLNVNILLCMGEVKFSVYIGVITEST